MKTITMPIIINEIEYYIVEARIKHICQRERFSVHISFIPKFTRLVLYSLDKVGNTYIPNYKMFHTLEPKQIFKSFQTHTEAKDYTDTIVSWAKGLRAEKQIYLQ